VSRVRARIAMLLDKKDKLRKEAAILESEIKTELIALAKEEGVSFVREEQVRQMLRREYAS
jgi:hypothetical protein